MTVAVRTRESPVNMRCPQNQIKEVVMASLNPPISPPEEQGRHPKPGRWSLLVATEKDIFATDQDEWR